MKVEVKAKVKAKGKINKGHNQKKKTCMERKEKKAQDENSIQSRSRWVQRKREGDLDLGGDQEGKESCIYMYVLYVL